jgi:catechol 2,3-dioxygenase-like lactoylglutathione lyase family enzyme
MLLSVDAVIEREPAEAATSVPRRGAVAANRLAAAVRHRRHRATAGGDRVKRRGESASAGAPLEAVRGICELVLETDDLERLEGFYNSLGLEPLQRRDDRIWLAAGGRSRLGIPSPGCKEHGDRGGRHVQFAISA